MPHLLHSRSDNRAIGVFAVCSAGVVLSMFYRVATTLLSAELSRDLGLSTAELSRLSAVFFYSFALAQIPLGLAMDRYGPRRVMLCLGGVGLIGGVGFTFAQTGFQALCMRALIGLGMGGQFMGGLTMVAMWFPPRRFATITGLYTSLGGAGMLVAATPLALLSNALGWRGALLVICVFQALQLVFFWRFAAERREALPQGRVGNPFAGLIRLFHMRAYWILSLGTFFRFGAYMAVLGLWAGPFLMYGHGLDKVSAGNPVFCMALGYLLSLPVFGELSDHVFKTRKKLVIPFLFVYAGQFTVMAFLGAGHSQWFWCLWFFGLGLISAPGQLMITHIKELVPTNMVGTALTGLNLFTILGSAVMMQLGSWFLPSDLSQLTGPEPFAGLWMLFAVGLALAGVLYIFTPESGNDRS